MTNSSKTLEGSSLHICYFGLREPLVQTQVLPYLRALRDSGMKISIVTFETNPKETWSEKDIDNEKSKLAAEGIHWYFLTYHKTPTVPATFYDTLAGAFFTWKFIRRENPDIIHGRVHIPVLMGAIARKFTRKKPKLLFDIRGFFPEEYTDAGRWKENGWLYHTVKKVEKWLLKESDGFVVLTERARRILFPESKETGIDKSGRFVEVIPCCVDLERFNVLSATTREEFRAKYNLQDRFVIIYVGSFGGWYLTQETADFLAAAKEKIPNTFALILTQTDPDIIKPLLESNGFTATDFLITKVSPAEIPFYLSGADIAVSFIKECYSKQASSPTKNAEYLACGLPIIANDGIGDTTEMTREDKTGIIIEEFSSEAYQNALRDVRILLENPQALAENCKLSAAKRFNLKSVGGAKYISLYKNLIAGK